MHAQEDMYDYAQRPRRTIAEVLQEFRSSDIPLEYVADVFPEIRPRQFSIASASVVRSLNLLCRAKLNFSSRRWMLEGSTCSLLSSTTARS